MIRLYAFPVHSASVERLCSELGGVLTETRNRTAFEKAFRIVKVRSQLRCKRKAKLPAAGAALRLQRPARSTAQPARRLGRQRRRRTRLCMRRQRTRASTSSQVNLIHALCCTALLYAVLFFLLFLRCARCAAACARKT